MTASSLPAEAISASSVTSPSASLPSPCAAPKPTMASPTAASGPACRRSQCLPDGGNVNAEQLAAVARRLLLAVEWVQAQGELRFTRDPDAAELWNEHYSILSQASSGLRATATGRAEAQVLRLSALYAALDRSPIIQLPHLQAALALWDYCSYSAGSLFGSSVADSVADRILEALQAADNGLTRKQIRDLFHGHVGSSSIDQALEKLRSRRSG